jgi:endonuclease YncB( thermonuclease family)
LCSIPGFFDPQILEALPARIFVFDHCQGCEVCSTFDSQTINENVTPLFRSALAICLALSLQAVTAAHAEVITGRIVGISDGDTVTLLDTFKRQYKIRLTGIDAPEKKMPFGQRSKEHLSDLIFSKDVQVETEKLDRYGRTLGKIVFDRKDINLAMINAGLAWHYKKYQQEQSASDRLLYSHGEEQARFQRTGLWRDPNPTPPWDWRKGEANQRLTP